MGQVLEYHVTFRDDAFKTLYRYLPTYSSTTTKRCQSPFAVHSLAFILSTMSVNRLSIDCNNTGVRLLMIGNYLKAMEHFRDALVLKLDYERSSMHESKDFDSDDENVIEIMMMDDNEESAQEEYRCVTPEPSKNENHVSTNMSNNSTFNTCENNDQVSLPSDTSIVPLGDSITATNYLPYLCTNPLLLSEAFHLVPSESSSPGRDDAASVMMSCIIIFNLGLTHHLLNRSSYQAMIFYKIAASLLSSSSSSSFVVPIISNTTPISSSELLFRIVLLNNYAVWCYDNHQERDTMSICFHQLVELLPQRWHGRRPASAMNTTTTTTTWIIMDGIQRNIRTLVW
jgi:hypothetical protein